MVENANITPRRRPLDVAKENHFHKIMPDECPMAARYAMLSSYDEKLVWAVHAQTSCV